MLLSSIYQFQVSEFDCPMTKGLFGTFNGDDNDDLMTPDGNIVDVLKINTVAGTRKLYKQFGMRCKAV